MDVETKLAPETIGLGAPVAAVLLFAAIFNPWLLPHLPKSGLAGILASPQIYFLLASLVIMKVRHLRWTDVGVASSGWRKNLAWGGIASLAPPLLTLVVMGILTLIQAWKPFLPRPFFGGEAVRFGGGGSELFVLLVLAPITEELFFRGILLRALRETYSPFWSVLFSALIFMGGHGGFKPGPLLLGLITAPIALKTRSILPGILFHSVSNAYGPLMARYFPNLLRYLEIFYR